MFRRVGPRVAVRHCVTKLISLAVAPVYRFGTLRVEDVKHDEPLCADNERLHAQRAPAAGEAARRGAEIQTLTLASQAFQLHCALYTVEEVHR